jgi:hypothetical protein
MLVVAVSSAAVAALILAACVHVVGAAANDQIRFGSSVRVGDATASAVHVAPTTRIPLANAAGGDVIANDGVVTDAVYVVVPWVDAATPVSDPPV